jgi:tetratricopeptide (TPR) repeat protein
MRLSVRAAALLISLASLAAYANSFGGTWVFDDHASIVNNPTIRQWSTALFPPPGGLTVSGRPILNLSFAASYALSGYAPWGHHLLNWLIHTLAGLTLFGLVRRTLLLPSVARPWSSAALPLALFTALLWTLHPLQTESVTYIVQRAESLMGLFFLFAFYAYLRGAAAPAVASVPAGPAPTCWLGLSVVSCLLGVATKEVAVGTPVLVLLHDRAFITGTFRAAIRRRPAFYLGLFATWLPLAALVLGTGGNRGGTTGFDVSVAPLTYWLTQFEAVSRYLSLACWPHPLVFEYGLTLHHDFAATAPFALLVITLVGATLWAHWRRPALGFFGAWFLILLAPTCLTPSTVQTIVEHRTYLALAALLALAVLAAYRYLGHRALWLGVAAALALATLTEHRNRDYRSELTLWGDTVAKRPANASARNALGLAHLAVGANDAALTHLATAVQLSPTRADYLANYAGALARNGQLDQAIARYGEALRLNPRYAEAHASLALVLSEAGRPTEALHHAEQATRLAPRFVGAHSNRGVVLLRAGRPAEAAQSLQTALALDASLADAHNTLGVALVQLGRRDEAAAQFHTALRLRPDYPEARDNLARLSALAR